MTVCSLVEMNELIVRLASMLIYTGRPWLINYIKLVWDDVGRLEILPLYQGEEETGQFEN